MNSRLHLLLPALAVALGLGGCSSTSVPAESMRGTAFAPAALPPPVASTPAGAFGASVFPSNAPQIRAASAIMIDARTGQTLYFKNPDQVRPVASTQKLVTAMVLLEHGSLDVPVTVSQEDTLVEPSRLNLRPGETYPRRQLLTAMMVKSSNDAAACLARTSAGSIPGFSQWMNEKARELGASNSRFINPHGLPAPGQHSTARDMARIAFAAYRQPALREMMRQRSYAFRFNSGRTITLETTNKLLNRSSLYNGMKTGYTNASGRCLVTSAALPGHDVILVQLGSDTRNIFDDAEKLVRWRAQQGGGYLAAAAR